jgi:hypothetical protein
MNNSGRKKDSSWAEFDVSEDGKMTCKYCKSEVSGKADRLRNHIVINFQTS